MSKSRPEVALCAKTLPALAAFLVVIAAGCSGGGARSSTPGTSGDFVVLRSEPANNGRLYLNEPLKIDFSNEIDPGTVDFNAVAFQVFDLSGKAKAEPVPGTFRITSSADGRANRRLEFVPLFPVRDTYDDGGFKPGRIYQVQLISGDSRTKTGLRDIDSNVLRSPVTFNFTTADGTTPQQLFRDTKVGGPRRAGLDITPRVNGEATLNELGQQGVEVRLIFDQPLSPSTGNIPTNVVLDPALRDRNQRGSIYLEYDDRDGKERWLPASVELESNTPDGSVVTLRPAGVLPNDVEVRVIVQSVVADISGETNVSNAAYNPIFGTFRTQKDYGRRFDAVVEDFIDVRNVDLTAPILEPLAEIVPGAIRASFDFEGRSTTLDYEPDSREVILDTDFTQITPKNSPKLNVSGGLFEFRRVKIPANVTVRGVGSRPMVWLVLEDFEVQGKLLVEGGHGEIVRSVNSANIPAAGGSAGAAGGAGGAGSPQTTQRSLFGQTGFGPGQTPGAGGGGGAIYCQGACGIGSGGGGGSFVTQGDPYYLYKAGTGTAFTQQKGGGGYGCRGTSGNRIAELAGGLAGQVVFQDPRVDNDFWGSAVDVNRQIRIAGELSAPRGGTGGGGGGDYATSCSTTDSNFFTDQKGGGGGGGGGVLIIKALGRIIIGRDGVISVNGGNGGGGAELGGNTFAGGGGGGSGGMVVLIAGTSIDIVVHGPITTVMPTYGNGDNEFAISADGGIGMQNGPTAPITTKYQIGLSANLMDSTPTGGLGGLGLLQLMAPPGVVGTSVDGTNTILDDNINFYNGSVNGAKLIGTDKQALLGWRGMPNAGGVRSDDKGTAVNLGEKEGDMRPSPELGPSPIGSRTRLRSTWIDLGGANRRMTTLGGDGRGRGVDVQPGLKIGDDYGPKFSFSGTNVSVAKTHPRYGFIDYVSNSDGTVSIKYPEVGSASVASVGGSSSYQGTAALAVLLSSNPFPSGAAANEYSHYIAQLWVGSTVVQEHRILGHSTAQAGTTVYLATSPGALPSGLSKVSVVSKFVSVFTGKSEGFPQTYTSGANQFSPKANVQIGFAFHVDPSDSKAARFPATPGEFTYDLESAAAAEALRTGHYRFIQWDVLFDTIHQATTDTAYRNEEKLSPLAARPELRHLIVRYSY